MSFSIRFLTLALASTTFGSAMAIAKGPFRPEYGETINIARKLTLKSSIGNDAGTVLISNDLERLVIVYCFDERAMVQVRNGADRTAYGDMRSFAPANANALEFSVRFNSHQSCFNFLARFEEVSPQNSIRLVVDRRSGLVIN